MTETIADWIRDYQQVRSQIKAMDAAHEEAKKEWVQAQDFLGAKIMKFLETNGTESSRTAEGTAYLSTKYSASLPDPEAFLQFVIKNQMWDLMDRKANKTAVVDYVEKHKELPPGCNLSAIKTVGVRKA